MLENIRIFQVRNIPVTTIAALLTALCTFLSRATKGVPFSLGELLELEDYHCQTQNLLKNAFWVIGGHLEGRRGTATLFLRPEESVLKDQKENSKKGFFDSKVHILVLDNDTIRILNFI